MKRFTLVIAILVSIFLLVGFSLKEAAAETKKPITIKLGTHWPATHVLNAVMVEWVKDIETSTGGRIKVKFYHSGTLSPLKRALEILSSRVADVNDTSPPYYPGRLPSFVASTLPFLFSSCKQASQVLTELIPTYFDKECEVNNVKLLGVFTPPLYQLINKKPVHNIEELKGLRVRSYGLADGILKALGAKPLFVAPPEIYTSLQRGILDSVLYPICAATAFKFHEVAKYVTVADIYTTNIILAMNLDTWNSLPQDLREIIEQTGRRAAKNCAITYYEKEREHFGIWKKAGVKFYTLPEAEMARWKKRAAPLSEEWIKKAEAKDLLGKEIMDEITKLAAKYK